MKSSSARRRFEPAVLLDRRKSPDAQPSVCLIVPIRNERDGIERLVAQLRAQDYPALQEVWLVDGMSDDGTASALRRLTQDDPRFRVIDNPQRLPAAAINRAISLTRSQVVMRCDAHASYEPTVVRKSVEALLESGAGGVGCLARVAPAGTAVGRAIVAVHQSPFGVGVASFRREGAAGWVDTVWNGCYWKHVLDEAGPLREDLPRAEDNDLNERIRRLGYGLFLSPEIGASYQPRQSLSGLWRQYVGNGTGVARTLMRNPRAVNLRHLAPLGLLVAIGLPLLAGVVWTPALYGAAAILLIYVSGLLVAAVQAASRSQGLSLPLLLAAFATLHFGYGVGVLRGLIAESRAMAKGEEPCGAEPRNSEGARRFRRASGGRLP